MNRLWGNGHIMQTYIRQTTVGKTTLRDPSLDESTFSYIYKNVKSEVLE